MFKMSLVCTHARCQSLPPLADSQVNDVLLHTMPNVSSSSTLFIRDSYTLHLSSKYGLDCWAARGQDQWSEPSFSAATGWYHGVLSCWKTNLLRQQDIAVVLVINFNSGVDKHQLSHTMALKWPSMCWCAVKKLLTYSVTPIFDSATDSITDLLNVERLRSRRLGWMNHFLTPTGA